MLPTFKMLALDPKRPPEVDEGLLPLLHVPRHPPSKLGDVVRHPGNLDQIWNILMLRGIR